MFNYCSTPPPSNQSAIPAMADQNQATMNRLPIASLMSPPEGKPLESFNSTSSRAASTQPSSAATSFNFQEKLPPMPADRKRSHSLVDLPSPPVTPATANKKQSEEPEAHSNRDPVLFHERSASFSSEQPLFEESTPTAASSSIARSLAYIDASRGKAIQKHIPALPTRGEYRLCTCVFRQFNQNPGQYAGAVFEENNSLFGMIPGHQKLKPTKKTKASRAAPKANGNGRTPARSTKPKRTPKNSPKEDSLDSFDGSPRPTKQRRVIGATTDPANWADVEDFCPPTSAIPPRGFPITRPANGGLPKDLSDDPLLDSVHPAEVKVASAMRLSLAMYLLCKRRLFKGYVEYLREELARDPSEKKKVWNKTAGQKTCHIDVNKTSALWATFDNAGWFDLKYFKKYL